MTKSEFVAAQLKNEITAGVWETGAKLPSEAALCEKYTVSRLSIRNAMGMLAAQGLVVTQKGRGSFVCGNIEEQFLPDKISRLDLFEFRRILETQSAGLAAQRADGATIRSLRDISLAMCDAENPAAIAAYDEQFHRLLASATQNELIIHIFDMLKGSFQVMFQQNVSVLGAEGGTAHLKIVAAIEARNSELASEYMQEHLNTTMEKTSMLNYSGSAAVASRSDNE